MSKPAVPASKNSAARENGAERGIAKGLGASWKKFAGVWRDNPDFDRFTANVAAYRREREEEQGEA